MKLEPTQNDKSARDTYALEEWPDHWHPKVRRMLESVDYLENELDYPPVVASYSHENLIISPPDHVWTLSISPSVPLGAPARAIYLLRCPLDKPWFHATAYAADLEDVGKIIAAAISSQIGILQRSPVHSAQP